MIAMHKLYTKDAQPVCTTATRPNMALHLGLAITAAALTFIALPVHAATFTPPSGCTLEVTAQNRSCTVSQYYRCTSDAPGDQRTTIFTSEGPSYESLIDKETRWTESHNLGNGIIDHLVPEARDHASFSTLLKTGRDDFDFWTESNDGQRLRHVGHDILTGEKTQIGGVELEVTQFDLKTYSAEGDELMHRTGNQFISRKQGRFYGGVERASDWTGVVQDTNDSPVTFAFPGQPGFGETKPQYDCDLQMVRNFSPMPGSAS